MFKSYGEFCASQPWEILVGTLVILISVLTYCRNHSKQSHHQQQLQDKLDLNNDSRYRYDEDVSPSSPFDGGIIAIIVMMCMGVIHLLYRFKKILQLGSAIIFYISLSYFTLTFILFMLVIQSVGGPGRSSVGDAWFVVPLLNDMQKVARMAQVALCSSHRRRISENMANAMYVLGPSFSLDTVDKVLLFGFGLYLELHPLGVYAWYSVVTVLVNFVVYFTLYPAALSVLLDLKMLYDGRPMWDVRQIIYTLPGEEGPSPNVQKVKVGSTALLLFAHTFLAPAFLFSGYFNSREFPFSIDPSSYYSLIYRNLDRVIFSLLVLAATIKYLLSEDVDEARELRRTYIDELNRKFAEDSVQEGFERLTKSIGVSSHRDAATISADEGISVGSSNGGASNESNGVTTSSSSKTREFTHQRPVMVVGNDDSDSEFAWSEADLCNDLMQDREVQTGASLGHSEEDEGEAGEKREEKEKEPKEKEPRSLKECVAIKRSSPTGAACLTDEEVLKLVEAKEIKVHALENALGDNERGVVLRRRFVERETRRSLDGLPYADYDYATVKGACCESVIGYMTLPVGKAGPLYLDGIKYEVPMATTEGCLVASVNRGCAALRQCGVKSQVTDDGMTRGPILRFPNIEMMAAAKVWMEQHENYLEIKREFDSTSRFARLQNLKIRPAGRDLFVRFVAKTGDAMGMNMLSKATDWALRHLEKKLKGVEVVSLSGNFCTDKKPAAVNWIDGRGKSVVCEATVPANVVRSVLKIANPADLVELNKSKNLVGSAMAGSIGGNNAQAANVVAAIFIATGQDAAQAVASSNCLTQMELRGEDLYVTTTMPSIEVGTVGGGTILPAQGTCLALLGVRGSHPSKPGENATQLARIICATVLAGELSLMSALAEGHLVNSHMKHNRSSLTLASTQQQCLR